MKTVVLGLFDDVADAQRVLVQLTGSPLDLGTVQVIHADPGAQRALASDAGLPPKRAVTSGLVAGAVLGGMVGSLGGTYLMLLAPLGTALSAAAGVLLGAGGGAVLGAVAERVQLPTGQEEAVLAAIEEGATAVVVQTDNLPTARAIRDLFQAGGSRVMPAPDLAATSLPAAAAPPFAAALPPGRRDSEAVDGDHIRFAPPWRRRPGDTDAPNDAAGAAGSGPAPANS